MNSSYLSYNQNDFFWVSVKDNFDFKICKKFEPIEKAHAKQLGMVSGNQQNGSCNCPTQTKCKSTKNTKNTKVVKKLKPTKVPPTKKISNADDYAKEVCHNYKTSKTLVELQNETSASQRNFSDMNDQYNKKLRKVLNVTVGIVAIAISIGFS